MNKLGWACKAQVIGALVEGNSIRSTCRMTGTAKGTILSLLENETGPLPVGPRALTPFRGNHYTYPTSPPFAADGRQFTGRRPLARLRLSCPLSTLFPQPPARARTAAALAVLALFTLFTYDHALTAVGNFLVVEDLPSEAEAIVVLSGDLGARLEQGVELYRQGYAPRLILAGGGQPGRPSAAEVMKRQAVALGVPSAAALLVNESTSTREDALFTL